MRNRIPLSVALTTLLLLTISTDSLRADEGKTPWIRSSGNDLLVGLHGEVFEPDGGNAADFQVTCGLNAPASTVPVDATINGNRFELWIPVSNLRWHSMWLRVTSKDEERVAYKKLNAYELRQAAIDGVKLTLQRPTRHVKVKVTEADKPVSGATVLVDVGFGLKLRAKTGSAGIVRFGLLSDQSLYQLTSWTDDYRIGGYNFHREPVRDPHGEQHIVELSKCRDHKLRFVDEANRPVAGVDFVIHMATAEPDYNFIGAADNSRMTTDAAGEVTYRWFPDWEQHYYYAELNSAAWKLDGDKQLVDGATVFKLKKSKPRKRVEGSVRSTATGVGGFFVTLRSFQGEQESMSDVLSAFTDSDGKFSVDVLPDATYCAYVLDSRWVAPIVDLIPFQTATQQVTPPTLTVTAGQPVEVLVTSGKQQRPIPNLTINLQREHRYDWQEDGETRHGLGGPQWWATTDSSGRATTLTLPGPLRVSVRTPEWEAEEKVEVRNGEETKIKLHRVVEEKQKRSGRLVLTEDAEASLGNAEIRVGAVDGTPEDQQQLVSLMDGTFSFETLAAEIGIFAYTHDGLAAGSDVLSDLESPINLNLRPTVDCHGQLLGSNGKPVVNHGVRAIIWVEGKKRNLRRSTRFDAKHIDVKTDDQGNFTLPGVPTEMKVSLYADAMDDATRKDHLDDLNLRQNDARPRAVFRLSK